MAGLTEPDHTVRWIQLGFQFATLGSINGLLMISSRNFIASVKERIA